MLQQALTILSNYFLNPAGLAALTALIPLIIFYLMRPSPQEKIMPSMKFFQEDKKPGKLQKALKVLQRNFMLILHILVVVMLALAIANPYINAEKSPEKSVIVLDNSASMKPVFQDVKQKAISHTGKENTVILAGSKTKVLVEEASRRKAINTIEGVEPAETGTEIGKALEMAQTFQGKIFVASDLDETVSKDPVQKARDIAASRPFRLINPSKTNKWGIVDLKLNEENATAVIQSYMDRNRTLTLETESSSYQIDLEAGQTAEIKLKTVEGENTLKLPSDGFKADNKAFIYRPESQKTRVSVLGDNRYLRKAVELIENVKLVEGGGELPSADVYIAMRYTDSELENLFEKAEQGKGLVINTKNGSEDLKKFSEALVSVGGRKNVSLKIKNPVKVSLGNVTVRELKLRGERAMASPGYALASVDRGKGEVVFYGFESGKFRQDFMYPVFWKNLIERLDSKLSTSEIQRKVGETVVTGEEAVKLEETGFKDLNRNTYAVNLLNGDESSFLNVEIESEAESVSRPRSLRFIPLAAAIVLALVEIVYLMRRGELP
ncbi:MAG: BatA and WFA domain-containing protein [Candidatus Nanohalobium sp.]